MKNDDMEMALTEPWGTYKPSALVYQTIMLCHKLSRIRMLRRLALWIRRPVKYGNYRALDVMLWGLKLRLQPQGNVSESRILFTPGLFDRGERMFLKSFLRPGCIFLDIGANAGGYSFWVYSLFKEACRILAVEPDPALQQKMQFNIDTNGARSIRIAPFALGAENRKGKLIVDQVNKGENCLIDGVDDGGENGIDVTVMTLHSLLAERDIRRIDALKIDIEGHEFKVLDPFFRHAEKTLWPRVIIAEIQETPEHEKLKRLLETAGYRVCHRTKMNWIFRAADSEADQGRSS
jgi:FkbM family methyltransferase